MRELNILKDLNHDIICLKARFETAVEIFAR